MAVRRFAGCPEAAGDTRLPHIASRGLLHEALDNEDQLRAAFYRWAASSLSSQLKLKSFKIIEIHVNFLEGNGREALISLFERLFWGHFELS